MDPQREPNYLLVEGLYPARAVDRILELHQLPRGKDEARVGRKRLWEGVGDLLRPLAAFKVSSAPYRARSLDIATCC